MFEMRLRTPPDSIVDVLHAGRIQKCQRVEKTRDEVAQLEHTRRSRQLKKGDPAIG